MALIDESVGQTGSARRPIHFWPTAWDAWRVPDHATIEEAPAIMYVLQPLAHRIALPMFYPLTDAYLCRLYSMLPHVSRLALRFQVGVGETFYDERHNRVTIVYNRHKSDLVRSKLSFHLKYDLPP